MLDNYYLNNITFIKNVSFYIKYYSVYYEPRKSLINKIELSEQKNKVYKINAGTVQENVKHPLSLILEINKHVIPQYSMQLIKTHENSEFKQFEEV